jgi:hypothetical protein
MAGVWLPRICQRNKPVIFRLLCGEGAFEGAVHEIDRALLS